MSYNIEDFNLDFFSLKGKNAVVTGGNSGLGQAFALALAKAGANILVGQLCAGKGETQKMIEDTGVKYEFIQADISKPGIPKQIVENCVNSLGSIDILVNCAGICICKDVLDFGRSEWDPMIAINLTAAFELSHEAAVT